MAAVPGPGVPAQQSAGPNVPQPSDKGTPLTASLPTLSLFSGFAGIGGLLMALLAALPTLIFNWGAAKLNWSVNQSWGWATLAFLFSGFYYPYYAFFQLPAPGILGAARRMRR